MYLKSSQNSENYYRNKIQNYEIINAVISSLDILNKLFVNLYLCLCFPFKYEKVILFLLQFDVKSVLDSFLQDP